MWHLKRVFKGLNSQCSPHMARLLTLSTIRVTLSVLCFSKLWPLDLPQLTSKESLQRSEQSIFGTPDKCSNPLRHLKYTSLTCVCQGLLLQIRWRLNRVLKGFELTKLSTHWHNSATQTYFFWVLTFGFNQSDTLKDSWRVWTHNYLHAWEVFKSSSLQPLSPVSSPTVPLFYVVAVVTW